MSILNTENYSLKERKRIRRQDPSMSIKDWLKDLSTEPGQLSDDFEIRDVTLEDGLLTVKLG